MSKPHSSPAHIVIIEDNPADELLLRIALDQQGESYTLAVMGDGEEAIRYVEGRRTAPALDPEPCAIILDLHLPKYDGIAVLQAIKAAPLLADVHVVVLTGVIRSDEERAVLSMGARLYRAKPTQLDEFIQLGQQIFEICRERAGRATV